MGGGDNTRRDRLRRMVGQGPDGPWGDVPGHLEHTYLRMLDLSDKCANTIRHSRLTLAEKIGVDVSTVTRHIAELEALGLLEVKRGPVVPREGRKCGPIEPGAKSCGRWRRAYTNRYKFCVPSKQARSESGERPSGAPTATAPAAAPRVPQLALVDDERLLEGRIRALRLAGEHEEADALEGRGPPSEALAAADRMGQLRAALPKR